MAPDKPPRTGPGAAQDGFRQISKCLFLDLYSQNIAYKSISLYLTRYFESLESAPLPYSTGSHT